MFDESTRVPLFIYHPQTPFASKHYWDPVELLDVYPTLVDLLSLPYNHGTTCAGYEQFFGKNKVCHQLQGKSLARVVLGDDLHKTLVLDQPYQNQNKMRLLVKKEALKPNGENLRLLPANRRLQNGVIADNTNTSLLTAVHDGYTLEDILSHDWQSFGVDDSQLQYFQYPMGMYNTTWSQTLVEDSKPSTLSELTAHVHGRQLANKGKNPAKGVHVMPKLEMDFAISQSWRCAMMELVTKAEEWNKAGRKGTRPRSQWFDCDKTRNPDNELSIMGYSLRTNDFRYTSWFHYNRKMCIPILDVAPYDEEVCFIN